jgi:uncharacterized protein involved in exopolysaccharide biosynthesis
MITNRELAIEDYLAIARRRLTWVLIPALAAPLLGFLISFALTPKYTSRSLLQVEGQIVPGGYVKPIVTERVSDRMITLQQNVLSRTRLQPLVSRLGLVRNGKSADDVIDQIRSNVSVNEADIGKSSGPPGSPNEKKGPGGTADVSGFYVSYTTNNPRDAQQVCAEITSLLLAENQELREQVARSTTDFLSSQLDQEKHHLDELDAKLSEFKIQHFGRLPGDIDTDLKMVMAFDSQLDAITQNLNRMQQDKSYAEMLLAQELAAYKSAHSSPKFPPLRQQLLSLQSHLVFLQTRYTEDHPDVVKTKHEIEELKAKLKDMGLEADKADADSLAKETNAEDEASAANSIPAVPNASPNTVPKPVVALGPPEIMRLREQIYRTEGAIGRQNAEQKRIQAQLDLYQSRLSLNPEIEEQYKQLTRDNNTAHSIYDQLLTNRTLAEISTAMEHNQEGEQLKLLDPATLPNSPSFPVRWQFALYGFGAGLGIGVSIALWKEFQDKAIRNEGDVLAALELPMLGSVPWVGVESNGKSWKNKFRGSSMPRLEEERTADL